MKMRRNLITAVSAISGAILVSQAAFAQTSTFVQGDLYLGFQNAAGTGSTADYMVNLGAASGILGQSSVMDLSSAVSLSLFNDPSLQGTVSQVYGGVVGGVNSAMGNGTATVYATALRTSNLGNPAVAGSSAPAGLTKQGVDDLSVSALTSILDAPAAATTGILDNNKYWEAYVEPTFTANSFYGNMGVNPDSPVSTSSVVYEDLWTTSDSGDPRGSQGQPWNYVGYFTLDLTGATAKLTFSSTNVPPSLTPPTIASVRKTGNTVTVISSNAVPNFHYQLQYTTSLNPTNWVNVGSSVLATGATVTNTDTTATAAQRFYQVKGQ